jgi:hypothetical protein
MGPSVLAKVGAERMGQTTTRFALARVDDRWNSTPDRFVMYTAG